MLGRRLRVVAWLTLYILSSLLLFHLGAYLFYRIEAAQLRRKGVLPVPAPKSTSPTANICVMSTVLSLDDVDERAWASFEEWCEMANMELFIIYKSGRLPDQRLRNCVSVHLHRQPASLPKNRIERIAALRNMAKRIPVDEGKDASAYDGVVVIDLDVEVLPTWAELSNALRYVRKEGWDVLCCNGYEEYLWMDQVYDLYPFVFKGGTRWLFEELDFFAYLTFLQPRLYEQIKASPGVYPLRSCFGGLAVYKPSLYLNQQCNYDTFPEPLDRYAGSDGRVCEHLVLHECLHHFHPHLAVGILPNLPVKRSVAWTIVIVPPLYLSLVGVVLILGRLLRVRRRLSTALRKTHSRASDADIKQDLHPGLTRAVRFVGAALCLLVVFIALTFDGMASSGVTRIRSVPLNKP